MSHTVAELASYLGARVEAEGDQATVITGIAGIQQAGPDHLTFVANARYVAHLKTTRAGAVLVSADVWSDALARPGPAILVHDNPYQAFLRAMQLFRPPPAPPEPGIDRSARIGHRVQLGERVHVGPQCVIEDDVTLGDGTVILAGSFVGRNTVLGADCKIGPNATITHGCTLGDRVYIYPGTVIGADGFGFAPVEGRYEKIPQLGGVTIGDDVEIGACCTVDRATIDQTVIGRGTKIDNHVMIAHNVQVGEDCIIVSQTGVAGSTKIGDKVTLAAQVGIVGHIEIGDGAIIMAQAGVAKSVPPGAIYLGSPAHEVARQKRIFAAEKSLPEHVRTIRQLEKRVVALEEMLKKRAGGE
ncbi:MAG TPA: UDP-3-O-(3-hydroxymyristoyl)glucosamine N-acyltransferase [Acidobacteriota bacterium]|nr:UDP-3-O-(3-hydroxymyristoyl)glucosamine N-acyltransferase [Acidobacteriota bacterium]